MLKTIILFALIQCSIRDVENVRLGQSSNELLNKKSTQTNGPGLNRIPDNLWLTEPEYTTRISNEIASKKFKRHDPEHSIATEYSDKNNTVKNMKIIPVASTPKNKDKLLDIDKQTQNNDVKLNVEKTTDGRKTVNVQNKHDESVDKNFTLNTAALFRAFYVFLGLSAVVLIYIAFKTIRVSKSNSDTTTVRKYGITAKRGDLEMLPLPLNEEEDDDTLFDVGTISRSNTS